LYSWLLQYDARLSEYAFAQSFAFFSGGFTWLNIECVVLLVVQEFHRKAARFYWFCDVDKLGIELVAFVGRSRIFEI
jgi:hypothetical protein